MEFTNQCMYSTMAKLILLLLLLLLFFYIIKIIGLMITNTNNIANITNTEILIQNKSAEHLWIDISVFDNIEDFTNKLSD
jgi:hypothetical protein